MRKLFVRHNHVDPIFAHCRTRFYASGRAALFHAVKSLQLPPGIMIMLPAYNCGVEVEAVIRAGYNVDFYRITNDLDISIDNIAARITSHTAGIVVPHYFGFPQDILKLKELCSKKNIVVIEDCAHALYSRNANGTWLGTAGDLGLFSMRKTVSMPNGGAVLVNRKGFVVPDKGKHNWHVSIIKQTIKSILENEKCRDGSTSALSNRALAFYQHYISRPEGSEERDVGEDERWYYDVPSLDYESDISAVSLLCSGKEDSGEIIARRRRNYQFLKNILDSYCVNEYVFPKLPDGTCPLCLPLFADQRDAVAARMTARGVDPYVFGRHPHPLVRRNEFPELKFLTGSIIGLPVHQGLNEEDMETVAEVFIRSRER